MPNTKPPDPSEMERRRNVARVLNDYMNKGNPDGVTMTIEEFAKKAGARYQTIRNLTALKRGLGRELAQKLVRAGIDSATLSAAAGFPIVAESPNPDDKLDTEVLLMAKKLMRISDEMRAAIKAQLDSLPVVKKKK